MKHRHGAVSLGVGLLAVGLAGLGEAVIRSKNFSGLGGALYLLGIVLFAIGAWPPPSAPGDSSFVRKERRARAWWRGWEVLVVAAVLAAGTIALMLSRLKRGNESATTVILWLTSAAVLLLAGILGGESTGWI